MALRDDRPTPEPSPDPILGGVKVIYIGGLGRSGSTLLDLMLGQIPGFFSSGEIRDLWQRGLRENRLCGCGLPFRDCPFWTEVGREAFGGWERVDVREALSLSGAVDRHGLVPLILAPRVNPGFGRKLARYSGILSRLYRAIHEVGGTRVIVDSSKTPSTAYLLKRVDGVDLRAVHLIRDSRGVAYSWTREVVRPDVVGRTEYMRRFGPARVGFRWVTRNLLMEGLPRAGIPTVRVSYESLVDRPRQELQRVLAVSGEDVGASDLDFIADHSVHLRPNHTVMGNPLRMHRGTLRLFLDDEWKSSMSGPRRALVTALTWPLLRRYGYGVERRTPPGQQRR